MLIISANSWTGNLTNFSGNNKLSMPSAISTGEVVMVRSEEPKIISVILKTIYIAFLTPWSVIKPPSHNGVPLLFYSSCKIAEIIIKNTTPFMLFSTLKNETFDNMHVISINTRHSPKPR